MNAPGLRRVTILPEENRFLFISVLSITPSSWLLRLSWHCHGHAKWLSSPWFCPSAKVPMLSTSNPYCLSWWKWGELAITHAAIASGKSKKAWRQHILYASKNMVSWSLEAKLIPMLSIRFLSEYDVTKRDKWDNIFYVADFPYMRTLVTIAYCSNTIQVCLSQYRYFPYWKQIKQWFFYAC